MPINKSTEYGNISISLDAIASLAGGAITECYGVVGMVSKNATEGLWELMKIENLSKGVKISIDNNKLNIDLYVMIEYGTKISVIANNIIQKVRYNVENYTGLKVCSITVNVQAVRV